MSKVFLYSRVSTSDQTLAQQERAVFEWLDHHGMSVDEIISDEGVSGGVGYADRKLGKELLPKMAAGDVLIVSEISRLGRSMFDLSKFIHEELKPRKIRLIVANMGLDLRCDNLKAVDELILQNFSFAAQLEKQLISARTKSALAVKKAQGVKLGGAAEKFIERYRLKPIEEIERINKKKAATKVRNHHESIAFNVMKKITCKLFPDYTQSDDTKKWRWSHINFSQPGTSDTFLEYMREYKEMDSTGKLFNNWDFCNDIEKCRKKLHPYFQSFRKSCNK